MKPNNDTETIMEVFMPIALKTVHQQNPRIKSDNLLLAQALELIYLSADLYTHCINKGKTHNQALAEVIVMFSKVE